LVITVREIIRLKKYIVPDDYAQSHGLSVCSLAGNEREALSCPEIGLHKSGPMKRQKGRRELIDKDVQRTMIELHLSTGVAKSYIWQLFTGHKGEDHGQILYWMRQLGYLPEKRTVRKPVPLFKMSKKRRITDTKPDAEQALQARIKQLEKQLQDSLLTAEAYRRMIQIAESELKIDIQKKSDTK